MTEKQASQEHHRFIAIFGKAHAGTHPVKGGCYPVPIPFCPAIYRDDKMLLFCLKEYPGYSWVAPGVGVVTDTKIVRGEVWVYYEYGALTPPIGRSAIMGCLNSREKIQLQYPRLKTHWLRQIEHSSATCIGF